MKIKNQLVLGVCLLSTVQAQAQSSSMAASEVAAVFSKMKPEVAAQLALQKKVGTCVAIKPGAAGANYLYALTYVDAGKRKTERFGETLQIQISPVMQLMQSSVEPQTKLKKIYTMIKNNLLIPTASAAASVGSGGLSFDPVEPGLGPGVDPVKDPGTGGTGTVDWSAPATISKLKPALLPPYQIPDFSGIMDAQAKDQLGKRVKALVQQSKCGSVTFETYSQKITDMKGKVDFYMRNGKLTCLAGDFEKRIRNPDNCQMMVVKSVLPDSVCNLLYQIEANHSGRTAKKDDPVSAVGAVAAKKAAVMELPALKAMTPAIEEEISIAEVIDQNPGILEIAQTAETLPADHMLPTSTLSLLENQTITATTFDTLTTAQKTDLVNLVRTHDVIKSSSEYVQFSPEIVSTINAIKVKANTYASANNIGGVYSIPKKAEISVFLDAQLAPLIKVTKKPFMYNLGCAEELTIQPKAAAALAL